MRSISWRKRARRWSSSRSRPDEDLENAPPPQASVHTRKQNKLGKLAQSYLRSKRLREQPCRFDVVAVVVNDEGGVKAIRHIPNAFSVAAW